ncbi:MAG: ribosome maturation factor RimP [Helicobacteraceae bacterium]|nr:ribosome maturation factor RimP [Helicobacteraceae bacterium]
MVENSGYSLYDIELLNENDSRIFRISITSLSGINHEDCQKVSEIISPMLDVYDPISEEYFLEVSSPGLERTLKKPNHFILSLNQKIEIKLNDKTKISGILTKADESGFYLDDKYFKYDEIKKAKSIFEW